MKLCDLTKPHRVFAWRPVELIDGRRAWLEFVWRRSPYIANIRSKYGANYTYWQ